MDGLARQHFVAECDGDIGRCSLQAMMCKQGDNWQLLSDERQLLWRGELQLEVVDLRFATQGLREDRYGHGLGFGGGGQHRRGTVGRVVDAVAQEQQCMPLGPIGGERRVDCAGEIRLLAVTGNCGKGTDVGRLRSDVKRADFDVVVPCEGFVHRAGRGAGRLKTRCVAGTSGCLHAGRCVDEHGDGRFSGGRRNRFQPRRVEQQEHRQGDRQRHQAEYRGAARTRNPVAAKPTVGGPRGDGPDGQRDPQGQRDQRQENELSHVDGPSMVCQVRNNVSVINSASKQQTQATASQIQTSSWFSSPPAVP